MRPSLLILVMLLIVFPGAAHADLYHLWSHGYGDSLLDEPAGIAMDSSGSVVAAGNYFGTIDFGGGPLTSMGNRDIFVVRFDADGTHRWSRRFGDADAQIVRAMAMTPNGDVVITGYYAGALDFGGGPLAAGDGADIFVACLDKDGNHRWSKSFVRPQAQYPNDLAVTEDGGVVLTGAFFGRVDFGGGMLISFGGADVFLARFDNRGNHIWSERFGSNAIEEGKSVAVDSEGDVVLFGEFTSSIDFGDGVHTAAGDRDLFLARFDAVGSLLWSRDYGDSQPQTALATASSPNGEIAIIGVFKGSIDFGNGEITLPAPQDAAFLARLYPDGSPRWSMSMPPTTFNVLLNDVAASDDETLACGWIRESVTIDGKRLSAEGASDVLVLAFDESGHLTDATVQGERNPEQANFLTLRGNDSIVVSGTYSGATNLGGNDLPFEGLSDMFVATYSAGNPNYTPIVAFSAIAHGSAVEARWQLSVDAALASIELQRLADGDSLWVPLTSGAAPAYGGAYDDGTVVPGKFYDYRLLATVDTATYVSLIARAGVALPPASLSLSQNAPNPFRGTTSINYSLAESGPVVITIYDAAGRRVAQLDDGARSAGRHVLAWDGRDSNGLPLASGVYFYRLENTPALGARRMVLLK